MFVILTDIVIQVYYKYYYTYYCHIDYNIFLCKQNI